VVFRRGCLQEQSQFTLKLKWRKVLFRRILWQYTSLRGTKKQSQFQNDGRCDSAGRLVFSWLSQKGPKKDFMDYFRETAGYDIDPGKKIV